MMVETSRVAVVRMVETFSWGMVLVEAPVRVIFPPNKLSPVTFKAFVYRPPVAVLIPPANVDVAVPEFLMMVETSSVGVVSMVETFSWGMVLVETPVSVIFPLDIFLSGKFRLRQSYLLI